MNVLVPLGLALGLTIPVVVVFYLLKVRRHDEEVSSTFLWNDVIRDLAAHEPFQRLKWSVLLILQLLLLAMLTFAVARPFFDYQGESPVHGVLVIDASASMQTIDPGTAASRFARSIESARETARRLPEGSLATVILAASNPRVLVSGSADLNQVDRLIMESGRPTGASGNMREALLLARSLGGDPSARRIHVFTDGAFTLPPDLPEDLGAVAVTQVAETGSGNLGITTVSTRADPSDTRAQQVFARVENFSAETALSRLLVTVDGEVLVEREIEVPANGSLDEVFDGLPPGARSAEVRLEGATGVTTAFPLDNSAYALLQQRRAAQVLLVSTGNQFLEKVLTLLPAVELYRIDIRRYLGIEADRFDIVVFDDYLPPLLPRGNLLVVNPPERGPIRTNGEVRRPRIGGWERDNPLLAFVDLRDLAVNRARKLEMPQWARALVVTAEGVPLLVAGQDGDRRVAVVPFDLRESNLPLSPAFPILMSNLLAYLSPTGVVQTPDLRTGEPVSLAPLPQVEQVRVLDPSQQGTDLPAGGGTLTYAATQVPGVYRVRQILAGGQQTVDDDLFVVNLLDREESDVRPRMSGLAAASTFESVLTTLQREIWPWLAALALPLLLFEWLWFHRRT